jgi:hypothetical protein
LQVFAGKNAAAWHKYGEVRTHFRQYKKKVRRLGKNVDFYAKLWYLSTGYSTSASNRKGKPVEKQGRKAIGSKAGGAAAGYDSRLPNLNKVLFALLAEFRQGGLSIFGALTVSEKYLSVFIGREFENVQRCLEKTAG